MTASQEPSGPESIGLQVMQRLGGVWPLLLLAVTADVLLLGLGHAFQESPTAPTVIWPSAGLLLTALWLAPRSCWPLIAALHLVIETTIGTILHGWSRLPLEALFSAADLIDGLVGATLAKRFVRNPRVVDGRQVRAFVACAAVGSAAGAMFGAALNAHFLHSEVSYLHQLQVWWAGNFLGSLIIAPLVHAWLTGLWHRFPELRLRSKLELATLATLVGGAAIYVFTTPPGSELSILQMPFVLFALLTYAALRLPPRWVATLAAGVAFFAAAMGASGVGPFITRDPFLRIALLQTFLVSLIVLAQLLASVITQARIMVRRLANSEQRYRNFVQMSSEAVWCVEIDPPMALDLSDEQMQEWFRKNARLTECSNSYRRYDADGAVGTGELLCENSVWSDAYRHYLKDVAARKFQCDDLRVEVKMDGRPRSLLVSLTSVVESDKVCRMWGVARDVTELAQLNAQLLREQTRLKNYARQIVTAEERARRSTAVDLHDGIGQSLVAIAMSLEVVKTQAPPEMKLVLDELGQQVRQVQDKTRGVIADLSPPGLYDLGLQAALQWLAVYMRTHDGLKVSLDCKVDETAVPLDIRILLFKLVRELLRNVVKHAGVDAATVVVRGNRDHLTAEVRDAGRGFDWQLDMFGSAMQGFGLWSVRDRVLEVGGVLDVDAAPGRGATFMLRLPLSTESARVAPDLAHSSTGS